MAVLPIDTRSSMCLFVIDCRKIGRKGVHVVVKLNVIHIVNNRGEHERARL